jgi:SAM-dependent methyltransferase
MIDELVRHAQPPDRALDLACGTGQLAFPLSRHFREVWAVDQEPDMVDMVRDKAADAPNVRPIASSAETLGAAPESFDLVTVGNAFHRLDRDLVAGKILGWLKPGGYLALCWSTQPWMGAEDWQQAFAATLDRWKAILGTENRIPANWDLARQRRPDHQVLSDAGFELAGRLELAVEHHWSMSQIAGHVRSTSFLPPSALGDQAAAFDADLARTLNPLGHDGVFTETVQFACDLARKPAAV